MATIPETKPEDDMKDEYDLYSARGQAVRGKYAAAYRERLRFIRLAEDVGRAFKTEDEVNEALREYMRMTGKGPTA